MDKNEGAASLVRSDVLLERIHVLEDALKQVTDHFAAVMGGPMVSGRGITFANGIEGIPTIARAREVLRSNSVLDGFDPSNTPAGQQRRAK